MEGDASENEKIEGEAPSHEDIPVVEDRGEPPAQCRYCGTQLNDAAVYCVWCNHHTAHWRNSLKYWSSVVGLFAAIAAAATFVFAEALPVYRQSFQPDKVELLSLQSGVGSSSRYAVSNFGPDDIFLKDITVYFNEGAGNVTFVINKKILSGEIVTNDYDPSEYFLKNQRGFLFMDERSSIQDVEFFGDYANTAKIDARAKGICFERIYMDVGNSSIVRMRDWGKKRGLMLAQEMDVAKITYYNLRDEKVRVLETEIASVLTRPFSDREFAACAAKLIKTRADREKLAPDTTKDGLPVNAT